MINTTSNIFDVSNIKDFSAEVFEIVAQNEKVRIERIISTGQITPEGEWYDSEYNEWILLIQGEAEITFEDGDVRKLAKGDYFYIIANRKHRVSHTSSDPKAIWLAVHF